MRLLRFARNDAAEQSIAPGWGDGRIDSFFDNRISGFFVLTKLYGQVTKSTRRMPRCRKAMKDVASCDKLRGVVKQTLIRRSPNGETQPGQPRLSSSESIG
jgi:hypothetical protein